MLDLDRVSMEHLSPSDRNANFLEIIKGYSKEQALHEAARCVECGICTKSCPANMNIPEYIKALWEDDFEVALNEIYKTNPLPRVCGRICTHNCEPAWYLTATGDAVAICCEDSEKVKSLDVVLHKRHVSSGDFQQFKGAHSEKRIPTGKLFGLRKFDLVKTSKGVGFIKGKRSSGFFALMDIFNNNLVSSVGVKKNCIRLSARSTTLIGGWQLLPLAKDQRVSLS